jgi:hypothetical protein
VSTTSIVRALAADVLMQVRRAGRERVPFGACAARKIRRCCTASLRQIKTSGARRSKRYTEREDSMRTTRDAIRNGWLPCPETGENVDVGLSFPDCRNEHGCEDRHPSDCPLYVERVIRHAVKSAPPDGREGA